MARVLFLQATDPAGYPPLIHAAGLIAEHGHQVWFLSTPVAGCAMSLPKIDGVHNRVLAPRPSYVLRPAHYARYLAATAQLARRVRPDVVYASDPLGALPGLLAARLAGARLVYHEHDSPERETQLKLPVRLARRWVLGHADRVVFPNAGRASIVGQEVRFDPQRLRIVWNAPRREETPLIAGGDDLPLVLHYHGGVNQARLPLAILHAVLRFAGRVQLRVAGPESPEARGYLARMAEVAAAAGLRDCLDLRGELPQRSDLFAAMRGAHVGLALMPFDGDINMRHMTGASNKAFDYLAGGLALLVTELADWRAMFVDAGYAWACDPRDSDSIAAQIEWFLAERAQTRAMGLAGRAQVQAQWNYESQFAPLLADLGLG